MITRLDADVGKLMARLAELKKAFSVIRQGSIPEPIGVFSRDELGDLAESFNQMSRELVKAKEKEARSLDRIVAEEEKYRTLIEKSLDGIVISQNGKVVMVNKAFADMLGYSVDECLQTFGPESIAPEDRERVMKIHYSRMKGELGDKR